MNDFLSLYEILDSKIHFNLFYCMTIELIQFSFKNNTMKLIMKFAQAHFNLN